MHSTNRTNTVSKTARTADIPPEIRCVLLYSVDPCFHGLNRLQNDVSPETWCAGYKWTDSAVRFTRVTSSISFEPDFSILSDRLVPITRSPETRCVCILAHTVIRNDHSLPFLSVSPETRCLSALQRSPSQLYVFN